MKYFSFLILPAAAAILASGCTEKDHAPMHATPNVEIIQDMMDQPALKAQDYDPYTGEASSRVPPEGTVPQGYKPYKYKNDPMGASKNLKNPFASNHSPELLERGQKKFETYCMVCHGPKGEGDGPVAAKMSLKPPPLVSDKVKAFPDGHIFHIITDGQGVMASYAYQLVDENDRWAIVNYVRHLQSLKK